MVGARGRFRSATDALQLFDDFADWHVADERANSLEVAIASSVELNAFDFIVFYFNVKCLAACAFCAIGVFHIMVACVKKKKKVGNFWQDEITLLEKFPSVFLDMLMLRTADRRNPNFA